MSDISTGAHNPRALPTGAKLPQYIIEKVLGTGGFGITYLARHETFSNKLVAIKEYMPRDEAYRDEKSVIRLQTEAQRTDFEIGLKSFYREARNLYSLTQQSNPGLANIVKVENVFEHNNTAYMVMDYIEGDSLESIIDSMSSSDAKLSEARLREIFSQIAGALSFMHSQQLLHRDITPTNIIVRRSDNRPILIDFGSAKSQAGHTMAVDVDNQAQAPYTRVIFTPGYAPLEQSEGLDQDGRTDIYSLAATMYHLTVRKKPIPAPARRGTMEEGKPDPLIPASVLGKSMGYSEELLQAIDEGLGLRMRNRPHSIRHWLEPLGLYGTKERRQATRKKTAAKKPGQQRISGGVKKAIVAGVAVVLLAVAATMVGTGTDSDDSRITLAAQPLDLDTQQLTRKAFLKEQLRSRASAEEVKEATVAVEICDLLGIYRANTQAFKIEEAQANLEELIQKITSAGFSEPLASQLIEKVSGDFDFESGLSELKNLFANTGLGSDVEDQAAKILEKMQTVGQGTPRFQGAEKTLDRILSARVLLNERQFLKSQNTLDEATTLSFEMGSNSISFEPARNVVNETRRLYVENNNQEALKTIVENAADSEVLANANAMYAEVSRVDSENGVARSGASLIDTLSSVLVKLQSGDTESLIADLESAFSTAQNASFTENDWTSVVLSFRGEQQVQRLNELAETLINKPLQAEGHEQAQALLALVNEDVRTYGLKAQLQEQSSQLLKAITVLKLVSQKTVQHDYSGGMQRLNAGAETIQSSLEGSRLFASVGAEIDRELKLEIENRWEGSSKLLSAWRAPTAVGTDITEQLGSVLSLSPEDRRAREGTSLVQFFTELNTAVEASNYPAAFKLFKKVGQIAERLGLENDFLSQNNQWLQQQALSYATETIDKVYLGLTANPLNSNGRDLLLAQLTKADELITLSTQEVQDTQQLRSAMQPLNKIGAALENGKFSEANNFAKEAFAELKDSRFNVATLERSVNTKIATRRSGFNQQVVKTVASKLNEIHATISIAPIDKDALAASQEILSSLNELRQNPEVEFDWSTVADVDTSLSALDQAGNIADSYEYLQASKLLADTSLAFSSTSRWRKLLQQGVISLGERKNEVTATQLSQAGERIVAEPLSSTVLAASQEQYEVVKQIEASNEGMGQLGIEFVGFLRDAAMPIQANDYKWMQSDGKSLVKSAKRFSRLPGALKTVVALAKDVDQKVNLQADSAQKALAGVFAGLATKEERSQEAIQQKLNQLDVIEQDASVKGFSAVTTVAGVARVRLQRLNDIAQHLKDREYESAKQLVRSPVDEAGSDVLSESQLKSLRDAENALRRDVNGIAARALIDNNKKLAAMFDVLGAVSLDKAALDDASASTAAILNDQVDFSDALTARKMISTLGQAMGTTGCDGYREALNISSEFVYPSFNLSWLTEKISRECS